MYKKIKNSRGFTLIELIVVVGIVGILVGIASPRFTGYTEKARVAKQISTVKSLENSVDIFNSKNERFPRLSETAYTADEVRGFSKKVKDLSGKEVVLDNDGKYYDLDYLALEDYISIPDNEKNSYILQNPKGIIYYLENTTEAGEQRASYELMNPKNNFKNKVIEISNSEELAKIGNDEYYPLDGKYVQTADIDLSHISNWNPIGDIGKYYKENNKYYGGPIFSGTYDGQGYKITGLTIDRPSYHWQGLFGWASGELVNINIENASVNGDTRVGILVGQFFPGKIIENSHVSGEVTGNRIRAGLLAGEIREAEVKRSSSVGTIHGNRWVGGFVGFSIGSSIENSYSNADVFGKGTGVGGFAGHTNSLFNNVYSSGKVRTSDKDGEVGGLIGQLREHDNSIILFENSYWDINKSGQSDSAGGVGKTTSELMKKSTFEGWDFENIWEINEDSSYPILR